jgi:hypothetical protein
MKVLSNLRPASIYRLSFTSLRCSLKPSTLQNQFPRGIFTQTQIAFEQLQPNTTVSLPKNLIIEDPSILTAPIKVSTNGKTEEEFDENKLTKYEFPFLPSEIPDHIPIHSFSTGKPLENRSIPLEKDIFTVALRKDIVLNCIRYIRHAKRQPKKTKRMSEIAGSNKKPRPQKGGGTGQVGHRRNSAWRGGQKAHGPVIRDYSIQINKKVRALGMMMALTAKYREGNLLVVDGFVFEVIIIMIIIILLLLLFFYIFSGFKNKISIKIITSIKY